MSSATAAKTTAATAATAASPAAVSGAGGAAGASARAPPGLGGMGADSSSGGGAVVAAASSSDSSPVAATTDGTAVPLTDLVGSIVDVETNQGSKFVAEVFAYDVGSRIVVFQQRADYTNLKSTIHMVRDTCITSLTCVGKNPDVSLDDALPALNHKDVEARELEAVKRARAELAKIGQGVTPMAQSIFNALAKTLPAEWAGKSIKLLGVKIDPPYTAESCVGPRGQELERIKQLLTRVRSKLNE